MNGLITDIGTGDLLVEHKRAVVTDSDGQTVEAVLLAQRGEFKERPLIGAAVRQLQGRVLAARDKENDKGRRRGSHPRKGGR